jgi:glucose-6-phosphate isomerase
VQLPAVNGFTMGQLLFLLETQAVFAAALHRVEPFRQPGVEEAKRLAWAMAGRRGYEDDRAVIDAWMQKREPRFVV